MYYIDISKLLGKIAEEGYNKTSFARALGINRNTLCKYLTNYLKMPYEIVAKMAKLLNCSPDEAKTIFFAIGLT